MLAGGMGCPEGPKVVIEFPNPATFAARKPVRRGWMRRPNQTLPGNRRPALNTKQVADWLGYSTRTICHWAECFQDSGGAYGIPSRRHGLRKWVFDEDEVQQWCDSGGLKAMAQAKPDAKTGS